MPNSPDNSFCPYKGWQPFSEADSKYFFGRSREEGIILQNLYGIPLTVLYGESGAGKSSVLQAGIVARLRQEPRESVVV
ncbi:MAG: ATP-binding protein, partial [Acidobacteriota bacterium]|nr:ATP-binding protein [Acidobacteriota bacterium]